MAALLFVAAVCPSAFAEMACPEPRLVSQPDGTVIELIQRGDERRSWVETSDGYSVVKDQADGVWYYALTSQEHSGLESDELSEVIEVTISGGEVTSTQIVQAKGQRTSGPLRRRLLPTSVPMRKPPPAIIG